MGHGCWRSGKPLASYLVTAVGQQFIVQKLDQLYVLVSSALPTAYKVHSGPLVNMAALNYVLRP